MWHVWERGGTKRVLMERAERERDHLEDLRTDGRIILNGYSNVRSGIWSGLIWLRMGTGVRLL